MNYYLAPYVGSGTGSDPFTPRAAQSFTAIDLRPDSRQAAGFALVAVPGPDAAIGTHLGDGRGALTPTRRNTISNRLGVNLSAATLADLLGELMVERAGPGRWARVRPGLDGHYRARLGEISWSMPLAGGGTSTGDNFNRADESPATGWTALYRALAVVSNQANHTAAGTDAGVNRFNTALASDNHYAQVTVTANTNSAGVGIRWNTAGIGSQTLYAWRWWSNYGTWLLTKDVVGATTVLGTPAGAQPSAGVVLYLSANGSNIVGKADGLTKIDITDTAITGNLRTGLYDSANPTYDDFVAADLAAPGGNPRRSRRGAARPQPARSGSFN